MNTSITLYQVACALCIASFSATMLGLICTTISRRSDALKDRVAQVGFSVALTTAVVVSLAQVR